MNKKSGQIRYAGGKGQSGMTPGLKQADLGKSALKKQPLLKAPQKRKLNDRTMKKKSAAVAVAGGLHPIRSHPLRAALIVAVYLLAFIILDMITQKYEELPGIVTWYPPAGLTYALLLACGASFTPAVTIALFISSLFIYRMPQPAHLLFLWAFIISLIYGAAAAFLRRVIHFDWQLRKFRDVAWFIFMTVLVSALLAVLSVSSSALSSDMPRSEVFHSIFHWWIGETVGVLTLAPFLLVFVMPSLKRFMKGQLIHLPPHSSFSHFTPAVIAQAFTLIFMLYWVFGGRLFQDEMQPLYLISLPLIWIALDHGFKGATLGVLVMNFGVMLALSVFRTDLANLGELQLLMIVNCIVGLLMGAAVTEREQVEEALRVSQKRYRRLFEDSPISLWEEDFSEVKRKLDGLKSSGVDDVRGYLKSHPQEISKTIALVKVLDINRATLQLFKARNKEDLLTSHKTILSSPQIQEHILEELALIYEGKTIFDYESSARTINDEPIDIQVFWSVAPGFEITLSKVLVSVVDITQRKQAEKEMRRLINDLRNLGEVEKKNRIFAEALTRNVISISSTLSTDKILDSILISIKDVVPSDAINIMLVEGDHARIVRSRGFQERGLTEWVKQRQFKLDDDIILKKIVRSKKYRITSDTEKSEEWTTYPESAWVKSNIIVPILDDLTVMGFVNVDSITPGFYTDEHARHLEVFTDQISAALKNARLFESTQRRMKRMQSMTQIDQAINSSTDLNVSLEIVVINTREQLHADAVDILLINEATNSLVFSKAQGFKTDEIRKANLSVGSGLPGRAVLERVTVAFPDLKTTNENYFKNMLIEREGFVSYYCVPLVAKGQLKGVMEIYFRQSFQADQEWLDFLEMLAQQTAIAINNADLLNSLQKNNIELLNAYDTTLKGWVDALDMRDHETQGHTQRVTDLSIQLARLMGIKDAEAVNFQRGALLHDIGKVAVPDAILNKPGPLTEEEWVIMRKHPLHAYSLLSKSNYLEAALDIPLYHHEKWDGSGYPGGLKGDAIPQAARIFAIVDVWDALTSDRPYRKAWTKKKALQYIQEQSGKHFDPQVVSAFITILRDEQIGSN